MTRTVSRASRLPTSLVDRHFERVARDDGFEIVEVDIGDITFQAGVKRPEGKIRTLKKKRKSPKVIGPSGSGSWENQELIDTLREWRRGMAGKRGLPAFRIFTNKVLDNLASDLPASYDELHMVQGVGPYFVKRYGKEIIRIVKAYLKGKR